MKAYVTVGVSASGKTTWATKFAEENNGYVLSRDDIRKAILATRTPGRDIGDEDLWKLWNFKWEDDVTLWYNEALKSAIYSEEYNCIILADTNLNKTFRDRLIRNLEDTFDLNVEIVQFPISLADAIERDRNRKASVGEDVIRKQYQQWESYIRE